MREKESSTMDVAEIEANLPPLARSYGTEATIERGVDAKLRPLAHRDLADERPAKTRRVESLEYGGCWFIETAADSDSSKESLIFILPTVSMSLLLGGERVDDAEGRLLVTTHRILFIAKDEKQDLAIDAICVTLHAMTSEPEISVYCQLSSKSLKDVSWKSTTVVVGNVETEQNIMGVEEDDSDSIHSNGPIEIFFTPQILSSTVLDDDSTTRIHEDKIKLCEDLFRALGLLATLNPIYDDEEGDMNDADFFDLSEDAVVHASMEDDFICRLNNKDADEDEGATEEERNNMLARLDAVLTVPAEYERSDLITNGQFDDADESENLL